MLDATGTLACAASKSSKRVGRMPIEWSERRAPNAAYAFDHVVAKTPLGPIAIVWKSEQQRPLYGAYIPGEKYVVADSLDEAKEKVRGSLASLALKL